MRPGVAFMASGRAAAAPPAGWAVKVTTFGTGNPRTVNLPPYAAGDMLLIFTVQQGYGGMSASGWSAPSGDGNGYYLAMLSRVADGGEGSSVSVSRASTDAGLAVAIRIPAGQHAGVNPQNTRAQHFSPTGEPNPPSITPSWGAVPTTFIAVAAVPAAASAILSYPLPNNQQFHVSGWTIMLCSQDASVSSMNPAGIPYSGHPTFGTAMTVAIRK